MVLSEDEIKKCIYNKELTVGIKRDELHIEDIPINDLKFDTVTLELRLGNVFKVWTDSLQGEKRSVDPKIVNFPEYSSRYTQDGKLESDGTFLLQPQQFVICQVFEYIKLPTYLAGRIEGKSKLARFGVGVHVTAPTIQAGWGGNITLELYNHSRNGVNLTPTNSLKEPGMIIAQLILEEVKGSSERHQSSFNDQTSPLGKKTG